MKSNHITVKLPEFSSRSDTFFSTSPTVGNPMTDTRNIFFDTGSTIKKVLTGNHADIIKEYLHITFQSG